MWFLSEYFINKIPRSIDEFPLIFDILEVLQNDLSVNETTMNILISNIVCDTPAKSFLLNVKNFNAYFRRSSCIEEKDYLKTWVVLIEEYSPLRTNETAIKQNITGVIPQTKVAY